ncbi:hypothetical protein ACKWTF_013201 [Chironomus riparius]
MSLYIEILSCLSCQFCLCFADMRSLEVILTLILLNFTAGSCYKILTILPTPFKSHALIGESVVKQIARAGHDVTLISAFRLKEANVKNVVLTDFPDAFTNPFELVNLNAVTYFFILPGLIEKYLQLILTNPEVQQLLKTESFDSVIVEVFQTEALYGE